MRALSRTRGMVHAEKSGRASPRNLSPDFEGHLVGQVAPVEPAGAEVLGSGVGVDDDCGDAGEAPRLG